MNKKFVYGAIIVTFIVAVLALFSSIDEHSSGNGRGFGSISTTTLTTFLPSLGLGKLTVGGGCSDQYKTCQGTTIDSSGDVTFGGENATSTPASMTLAASDLDVATIEMLPTVGAITVTLPATTTAGMANFVPQAGDTNEMTFINSTSTAAMNITLVGGTGTILQNASSTNAYVIGPGKSAFLRATRKVNGDIIFQYSPYQ